MDNFVCHHCMWEGTQEELNYVYVSSKHNPQDHSLYEESVCPDCGLNEQLINIDEERRYEDLAHWNYYKDQQ